MWGYMIGLKSCPPHRDCLLILCILVIEISSFPTPSECASVFCPYQNQKCVGTLSHLLIHKSGVVRVSVNGSRFLPMYSKSRIIQVKLKLLLLLFF